MATPLRVLGLIAGIALALATLGSVFSTLVVPRVSAARMLRVISNGLGRAIRPLLRRPGSYEAKDRLLGLVGPLGVVGLFVTWVCLLLVAFGLIEWWTSGTSLPHALIVSGSSIFTLGILSVHKAGSEAVEFVTAGVGLLVIALEIAYLPAIYTAFSTREADVSLLSTRAGVPAWGPEVLARAQRFSLLAELPSLYRNWERWAAAVAENHTNYPSLMWLRSPMPARSWLTALTAMLDAAALQDALTPEAAPLEARLCLQVGSDCLRALAGALKIAYDPDPLPTTPIRLTFDEYRRGIDRLERAGFAFERTPEEAWRHFSGWRVNYEAIVDALTEVFVPPPAPWFPERPWLGPVRYPFVLNRTPDDPEAATPRT